MNVPYLYVNIAALCSYLILLAAFFAARRTPENRAFLMVLAGFTLWTAGSILMRLRVYPGVAFWFYVSLMALFSIMLALYLFVCAFAGVRRPRQTAVWSIGTAVLLALTATGVFLKPPTVETRPGGGVVFLYEMGWPIVIPCLFFAAMLVPIARILIGMARAQGSRLPGIPFIFLGMAAVAVGNIAQIIPGNVFPYDTLGGIGFAVCLTCALIQRRMFHLEQLVSPKVLTVFFTGAFTAGLLYFTPALEDSVAGFIGRDNSSVGIVTAAIVVLASWGACACFKLLFFSIFSRAERQDKALATFSQRVAQTLSTAEIAQLLADVLHQAVDAPAPTVLLEEDGRYTEGTAPRAVAGFAFTKKSACLRRIRAGEAHVSTAGFAEAPQYRPEDKPEKDYLEAAGVELVLALRAGSEVVGLALLPGRPRRRKYTAAQLDFMETAGNIAAIAIKNATLYERIYRESRMDHLTGLYSYNYFVVQVDSLVKTCSQLALVYLDIDDMKLYNQLYGSESGDAALQEIAGIIRGVVGGDGTAFRHSGKVFAILLPGWTAGPACALAGEIQRRVRNIHARAGAKPISLSGGVCTYPDVAANAQQLTEYADIAVFNAKNSGKGKVEIFQPAAPGSHRVNEQVLHIVSQAERKGLGSFSTYSATILALTAAIDAKDHYTYAHSQNVAYYASMLAVAAGLADAQVRLVYEAALLHDIGKISIPEAILGKRGPLSDEEREVMNTHVNNSIEIIRHLPSMDYVIPVAIAHHERWDGGGYPRGIAGEEIPVAARCLAVADTFDAMTSDRPYRPRCTLTQALAELEAGCDTQFDPYIARVFISLVHRQEVTVRQAPVYQRQAAALEAGK